MANTVNVQGDPFWAQATQNIAGLFNPKAQAQGAALLAQTENYKAQAAHNQAKADLIGDRRKALTTEALLAAGYTPRQVAAWQATATESMADAFKGIQTDEGTQMIIRGERPIDGSILLGGNSSQVADAILKSRVAGLGPNDTFNLPLATSLISDPKGIDGNLVTLDPKQGWVIGGTTEQGKVYQNKVITDTNESKARVDLTNTRAEAVSDLAAKKGETEQARKERIMNQLAIDDVTADAVIRSHDARTARTQAATGNDKTKADATAKATADTAAARVDATKTGKAADPVKQGRAEIALLNEIDERFSNDFAQLGDKKAWSMLDADQKVKLRNKTMEFIQSESLGVMKAMQKAYQYYGVSGNPSEGVAGTKGVIWSSPDGKVKINGFRDPGDSSIAGVVAEGSAPATTPPAPRPVAKAPDAAAKAPEAAKAPAKAAESKPAAQAPKSEQKAKPAAKKEVKPEPGDIIARTQADIDNAPSGAIIYVNGQRMKKP